MTVRKNEIDMLNGPLLKGLFVFSIPLILTNVLQLLFNAADVIVVGKFAGDLYLAAVSSTTQMVYLVTNVCVGLATGVNIIVARYIGENRRDKIPNALHTSILFGVYFGIFAAVLALLISRKMLILLDTPEEVLDLACLYLKIYFIGSPANLVYNYGAAVLRAKGDTKRPLYYLMISGIINVFLNIVMIVIFKMNVDGVAIATVASQTISAFLTTRILIKEEAEFKLYFSKLKINFESLKAILKYGIPASLQSSLFSISNLVLQSYINAFGTITIAANGISHSAESIENGIINAVQTSCMTFVSQNRGARNYKRIIKSTILGIFLIGGWCLLFVFVGHVWGKDILYFYSDSKEVVELGYLRMKLFIDTYFLIGMMHLGSGILRGLGYSLVPAFVCATGIIGVRLLCVWVFFKNNLTYYNVMLAYPISWVVASVTIWIILIYILIHDKHEYL